MANIYDVNAAIGQPNIVGAFQQGLSFGRQQREQKIADQQAQQLRNLAPQIVAGDPAAYTQGAAIDPKAAQGFRDAGDADYRRLKNVITLGNQARESAKKTGNYAPLNAYLRQVGPWIQQVTGQPAPTEWTPEMDSGWDQLNARVALAEGGSSGEDLKSLRIGANGNYWAIQGGKFVDTGTPAAPDVYVRDQPGVPFDLLNKRSGSSIYDAPTQAPPPAAVPAPTLDVSADQPAGSVDGTTDTGGPTTIAINGASPEQNAALGRAVDALRAASIPDDQIEAYVSAQEARFSEAPAAAPAPSRPQMRPQTTPLQDAAAARDQRRLELQEDEAKRKQISTSEKPLPVGALKEQLAVEEALGGVESVSAMIQKHADRLSAGKLRISPMASVGGDLRTKLGVAGANDVNLNELKADLTRITNESLRLNKGVQTEGDAQRAVQELMQANDEATMARAFMRLAQINRRGAQLQIRKRDLINQNYGRPTSQQQAPAPASGAAKRLRYNPATGRIE